ncbi:MAG: hypothetical protein AAFY19_00715 [Pseudomonadota bacterium]
MTAPRPLLTITPRLLRVADAASYVGLGETKFRELVDAGRIPKPRRQDGVVTWDVRDLDTYVDGLPQDGEVVSLSREARAI